ncbi:MAG: YdeI/OmpD-associated family protein [Saprospiraceae bacterium]
MKYTTTIQQFGNNTGIEISEDQLEILEGGKRPLVVVTLNNYSYRCAVGKMGNRYLISLSAEHRNNAGVKGGDTLDIHVMLDTAPRTVEIPKDMQDALKSNDKAMMAFEKLAPSKKKAMVNAVLDAKTEETRQRRINKAVEELGE